jgi:dTDP-L-rhamnose 4-epimerase
VIFEDGRQRRDYTHIRDAVSAVLIALDDSGAIGQAFNVGSGEITSVLEYAQVVLDEMGADSSLDVSGRYRVGDTRHVWSDTEHLRAIGWQPTGTLAEIVHDYVSWFKKLDQSADWAARALERMEASGTVRQASAGGA